MEKKKILVAVAILASSIISAYLSYYAISKYATSSPSIPEVSCHVIIEHSSGSLLLYLKVDRIVGSPMEWEYLQVVVETNRTGLREIDLPQSSGYVYPGTQIPLGKYSYGQSIKVLVFYKHQLVWQESLTL